MNKSSEKISRITFNANDDFKQSLQIEAIKRGITLTDLITEALKKELKQQTP